MNKHVDINDYAALSQPNTLTFHRTFPASVETVWSWLTESHLRRQWLAEGEMNLSRGAEFELVWRNDDLAKAPEEIGKGASSAHSMLATITGIAPKQSLSFTWTNTGGVTFTLGQQGSDTALEIVHKELPDRDNLIKIAAGWHAHLDILGARIRGVQPEPFWDSWHRLKAEYDQQLSV